jgi:predicted Zn-dependent peptidase
MPYLFYNRLFTTVRDSLGLTYDVSFEVHLFDKLGLGWYVISVTSTPERVQEAVDACKGVLRGLDHNKISQRELDRVMTLDESYSWVVWSIELHISKWCTLVDWYFFHFSRNGI